MKLKKNIATSEEGFIFNPATGDSFSTKPIGADIVTMLKEDKTLDVIVSSICEKYDVETAQFHKDLDDFEAQLSSFGILTDEV